MSTTTISEQLRAWRAAARLSQPQAAQRLGVPEGTYLHWEHGDRAPDAFKRAAILRAIGAETVAVSEQQTTNGEQL